MRLYLLSLPMAASLCLAAFAPVEGQPFTGVYNGPFTHVTGATPAASYDTGGFVWELAPGQTYTGSVTSEGGAGGFINTSNTASADASVNIGGDNETLSWGQSDFVPVGDTFLLGTGLSLANSINIGTDPTATRQIDIGSSTNAGTPAAADMFGTISGSGNLSIQNFGTSTNPAVPYSTLYVASVPSAINISGQLSLTNLELWSGFESGATVSAASFNLSDANLEAQIAGTPDITLNNGSSWITNATTNSESVSVGNLTSDSSSSVDFTAGILTSGPATTLTVHSGYFAGTLLDGTSSRNTGNTLIKDGPGTFTLAGNNTADAFGDFGYSGGTTVKQGTLLVANTTGSATGVGAVTVQSGGALGGTGTIAPASGNGIEIQSGGKLDLTAYDPANPPASFTNRLTLKLTGTADLTFDSGATLAFDLGPAGASDSISVSGASHDVIFNNNSVNFNFLSGAQPGTYTLLRFGAVNEYTGTLQASSDYFFTYNLLSISVTIESVPEPNVAFLMAGGLLFLVICGRKRLSANCQQKNGTKIA